MVISYGNFGRIHSGFSTRGRVFAPTTLSPAENYACYPLKDLEIKTNPEDIDYYPIILVDKGKCSYVQIARMIQEAGGYMAMIINDKGGDVKNYPVVDDGTGGDISIPTVLISKADGTIIKRFIRDNPDENIQIEIEFSTEKSDVVQVEYFTLINNEQGYKILNEFSKFYLLLKDKVIFTPHYLSYPLEGLTQAEKENNCVSGGKYCLTGGTPRSKNAQGKNLLMDSIFHQCFHKVVTSNETNYHPEYYFSLTDYFETKCLYMRYKRFCGKSVLEKLDIPEKDVDDCIYQSFGNEKSGMRAEDYANENSILHENYKMATEEKIKIFPTFMVNGKKLKGRLSAEDLFLSICSSFNQMPTYCQNYFLDTIKSKRLRWYHILFIILIVLVLNLGVIYLCRKYIKKRINERVVGGELDIDGRINSVVSSYFALKEKGVTTKGTLNSTSGTA